MLAGAKDLESGELPKSITIKKIPERLATMKKDIDEFLEFCSKLENCEVVVTRGISLNIK